MPGVRRCFLWWRNTAKALTGQKEKSSKLKSLKWKKNALTNVSTAWNGQLLQPNAGWLLWRRNSTNARPVPEPSLKPGRMPFFPESCRSYFLLIPTFSPMEAPAGLPVGREPICAESLYLLPVRELIPADFEKCQISDGHFLHCKKVTVFFVAFSKA